MKNSKNRSYILTAVATTILSMVVLLFLQNVLLAQANKRHARQLESIILEQVENVIGLNSEEEESLVVELMDDYITRARAVAYILENNSKAKDSTEELKKICELISVDEINIFNSEGVIYAGTVSEYFGLNFDSGEQIGFFKCMLDDKDGAICQGLTPNTAEEKYMMYAMCWNESGTDMIQVGIEPVRLVDELRSNEISEVISNMPAYEGVDIVVADKSTGEIIGSTSSDFSENSLDSIGIADGYGGTDSKYTGMYRVMGEKSLVTLDTYGDYIIAVIQSYSDINRDIFRNMVIMACYLILAAIVIFAVVRVMTKKISVEKENSHRDSLTGMLNRRAYEDDMDTYGGIPKEDDFVYGSMDLNGLKQINDTLGHAAGDEIIKGAGACIEQCFGAYGHVYRIGGDEFAITVFIAPDKLEAVKQDFKENIGKWRGNIVNEGISISAGYASKSECPDRTNRELAEIADKRMYEAKAEYYSSTGKDRRRH